MLFYFQDFTFPGFEQCRFRRQNKNYLTTFQFKKYLSSLFVVICSNVNLFVVNVIFDFIVLTLLL